MAGKLITMNNQLDMHFLFLIYYRSQGWYLFLLEIGIVLWYISNTICIWSNVTYINVFYIQYEPNLHNFWCKLRYVNFTRVIEILPFPEISMCRKIWCVCYYIIRYMILYLAIPARSIISNVEKLLYLKSDTYPRFLSKFIFCPRTNFWHIFACEYITVYIVPNKRADGTIEKTFLKYKCINILFWNIQRNIHLRDSR